MAKKLAEATGSITFSQRGEKGEKGDNGVGVKGFNTYYGLSGSKSSPPTAYYYNTLSDTIISQYSEMYVWSADKVLYTDGTGGDFINAYCIGKCSDLTSVKEQYGTSTSAGTKPSKWEYTYPSNPANGTYVWSRDEIVWAGDNSTTHSDAQLIGYIAINGEPGPQGPTGPQGPQGPQGPTGARGTKGALIRQHEGFESGSYKYLSGAGEEAYVDVVCVEGNWYQCTTTYDNATSSPSLDDGHWTLMNNYKSIATYLLLAENATIKMLGSNQINLYNPSGGAMYGSFRVVENNNDWSLWLGASTGDSAPFGVTRGGAIKSTSGTIGGVEISQDKLGVGVADIGNRTFKGAILSSGGIFAGYKTSYVGAGTYAADDPSGNAITMYDKKALTQVNVSSPSLYVRKYSPDSSIINNIDKYNGAALIVDVPIGVGVASLGNNVLGGLALSSCAGDFDVGSTDYLFQKNRGTVAYFTNSSDRRFYLPANPHEGQVVIVIQGSTGKITFFHPSKRLVIQNTVKDSGGFYSGKQGQLNIFVYIGTMWYGTYSNG